MALSSERFCDPSSASRDIVSPRGTCFFAACSISVRRAGRDGSRASVAATRSRRALQLLGVVGRALRLDEHRLDVAHELGEADLGLLVLVLAQGGDGFLEDDERHAESGVLENDVDLGVDRRGVGPPRDPAQQVEEVAAEVPLLFADRRPERARQALERRFARGRTVDLEQEEHQAAAVALGLARQRLEQALRLVGGEELQHTAQLVLVRGLLSELLELLRVERLAQLPPGDLGAAGVHLLLGHELLGELEHLHGLGQRSLVEPLDSRLDHLVETPGGLDRILRIRDDAAHRADRTGFVGRAGRARARRGRDPTGHRHARARGRDCRFPSPRPAR